MEKHRKLFKLPMRINAGIFNYEKKCHFLVTSWEDNHCMATCWEDGKQYSFSLKALESYGIKKYYKEGGIHDKNRTAI